MSLKKEDCSTRRMVSSSSCAGSIGISRNLTEKQWKNDQFWDDLIAETDKFCDKYCTSEDRFWVHPITALIDRIEDQARGKLPLCEIWDGSMQLIRALVERRTEVKDVKK